MRHLAPSIRKRTATKEQLLPRVAVLVDTATGWGRRLIRGIRNYAVKYGPWQLTLEPHGQQESLRIPAGWEGDGVIARVNSHAMARHVLGHRVPVINVSSIELKGIRIPTVCNNVTISVARAYEHFSDRGFRHFAYCGTENLTYVQQQRRAFANEVAKHGLTCWSYKPPTGTQKVDTWLEKLNHIGKWLESLPRPVGMLCWDTTHAQTVLHACQIKGIDVPGDVAVLGGDDDELFCTTTTPPMSGIITPSEQIGFEAAHLLDQYMHGKTPESERVTIDPVGISIRQSTDTLAIQDAEVASAIRFIRENSSRPIQVEDILREVPISRRALERRFERDLGRSPAEEIRRVRLAKAVELLATTDLPIPEVTNRVGFNSPQYFARVFCEEHGLTPLKYRNRLRGQ